jgi:hypothetical protein
VRSSSLPGGLRVWEVVRAPDAARAAEPDLSDDELLTVVEVNTGSTPEDPHLELRRALPQSA